MLPFHLPIYLISVTGRFAFNYVEPLKKVFTNLLERYQESLQKAFSFEFYEPRRDIYVNNE